MIDKNIYNLIREQDFALMPALDLRSYEWGSLAVYNQDVRERMVHYHSKYDLLHWMTFWTEAERLGSPFAGEEKYEAIKSRSAQAHIKTLNNVYSKFDHTKKPHAGYDIWNAIDGYIVDTKCDSPSTVLDFGAGYGRLGLVFGDESRGGKYIAVDCVEVSYMLQNLLLTSYAPERTSEYIDMAMERRLDEFDLSADEGIFHLPTWRLDLVPDESIDVVTAIFVLPEITDFALLDFIKHANRVVRKGGYIYLRDHLYHTGDAGHKGAHRFDTEKLLAEAGFKETYRSDYVDNKDIYGTPRTYQKQ